MRRITSSYYDYYCKSKDIHLYFDTLIRKEAKNRFELDEFKSLFLDMLLKILYDFDPNLSNFYYFFRQRLYYKIKDWRRENRNCAISLDENYIRIDNCDKFSDYMDLLNREDSKLLELIFVGNKTLREIGLEFGQCFVTIYNKKEKALRKLRERLDGCLI